MICKALDMYALCSRVFPYMDKLNIYLGKEIWGKNFSNMLCLKMLCARM